MDEIYVTEKLFNAGAMIEIFDPMVSKEDIYNDIKNNWSDSTVLDYLSSRINIINNLSELDEQANAIALLTEWEVFKKIDLSKYRLFEVRDFLKKKNLKG